MQPNPNHGYRGRVRSGCLTCRARKVKCDEARPVCNNCSRLERACNYKPRKEPSRAAPASAPQQTPWPYNPPVSPPLSSTPTATADGSGNAYVASVEATLRLDKALQGSGHGPLPPSPHDSDPINATPAALISRDIELTTTMDFLAAEGKLLQLSSSTFIEAVQCPGITPYDPVNWEIFKHTAVEIGHRCPAVALAINATSALHKALIYGLSQSRALALYESTKVACHELMAGADEPFDTICLVAFLVCVFELTHASVDLPFLKDPGAQFISRLRNSGSQASSHSDLLKRMVQWLKILYATTLRGGRDGLISRDVLTLLPDYNQALSAMQPVAAITDVASTVDHLFELLSAPLFDLYFKLQMLSGEIVHLTHYHRSRTTGQDQEEVVDLIRVIKRRLKELWENRCPTARQLPQQLRSQLTSPVADRVVLLIALCTAAYHAEIIEIDRVLGDPVTQWTDSRPSLDAIRDLIDGDWAAHGDDGKLESGFLRPLFLYAIESFDEEKTQWACRCLSEIQNPTYRSDFFSEFAKALASAQALKDRRVTSKYFCISYFGVPPPFL